MNRSNVSMLPSRYCNELASELRRQRIQLQQAVLPDFNLQLAPVDAVVFSFPDFRCDDDAAAAKHWRKNYATEWEHVKEVRKRVKMKYPDSPQNLRPISC